MSFSFRRFPHFLLRLHREVKLVFKEGWRRVESGPSSACRAGPSRKSGPVAPPVSDYL